MFLLSRNRLATPTLFESSLEPWSDLRREIDRLFDSVLWGGGTSTQNGASGVQTRVPRMDVADEDDRIQLSFEIPGVKPDDLEVTVESGMLTVSGEKKYERREGDDQKGPYSVERRSGRFERTIALPESVDTDNVTARYENGVLRVELPKLAESRKRRIQIGRGPARISGGKQKQIESGEKATKVA